MKVSELKVLLKSKGLRVSGNKAQLLERLLDCQELNSSERQLVQAEAEKYTERKPRTAKQQASWKIRAAMVKRARDMGFSHKDAAKIKLDSFSMDELMVCANDIDLDEDQKKAFFGDKYISNGSDENNGSLDDEQEHEPTNGDEEASEEIDDLIVREYS